MSTTGPNSGITIETKDLILIKKVIGYPKVNKILLTDEEIVDLCIEEPLRKYYNKWPKEVEAQYSIGTTPLTVPFPDDQTYGVKSIAIVGKSGTATGTNDFWNIVKWQQVTGYKLTGSYGVKGWNPNGLRQTYFDKLQQTNTLENRLNTQDYRVDRNNRQIIVTTSTNGWLDVIWGKYDLTFSNIKYERKTDVIKYCQVELLRHLADTVNLISDSDLSVTFNPDDLRAKAEGIEEKLNEAWDSIPDVVYLRQN
jgi:hypothetical protein